MQNSAVIQVDREPVKVIAFGLTGNDEVSVMQVAGDISDLSVEQYLPYGAGLALTADRNEIILHRSGRYLLQTTGVVQQVKAFWWPFSMTHEWGDNLEQALAALCECVTIQEPTVVAGPGILVELIAEDTWRITNTGIISATDTLSVNHTVEGGVLLSEVRLSDDEGNNLQVRNDGLYANHNDTNALCALGALVAPAIPPIDFSRLRFLVLDTAGCMRWVSPRGAANWLCEYECEGPILPPPPPPPSGCCALTFTHQLIAPATPAVGDTAVVRITATGGSLERCRAFTYALNAAVFLGFRDGWSWQRIITGNPPATNDVDFFLSGPITTWTADIEFVASACAPTGRTLSFTIGGECRATGGTTIPGSLVSYPINVTLPRIVEGCGDPLPPPSLCSLAVTASVNPVTLPFSVGAELQVDITLFGSGSLNAPPGQSYAALFINTLDEIVGNGWEIVRSESTPPGLDIRTGLSLSGLPSGSVTQRVFLRATSCVAAQTRTLNLAGACFSTAQLPNTYEEFSLPIGLPAVTANCSTVLAPLTCGFSATAAFDQPLGEQVAVGGVAVVRYVLLGGVGSGAYFVLNPSTFQAPAGWSVTGVEASAILADLENEAFDFSLTDQSRLDILVFYTAATITQARTPLVQGFSGYCFAVGASETGALLVANPSLTFPQVV